MRCAHKGFGFIELMVSMLLVAWCLALLGRTLEQAGRGLRGHLRTGRVMYWLRQQMAELRLAGGRGGDWLVGDHHLRREECLIRWTVSSARDGCLCCLMTVEHPGGIRRERRFWFIPFPEAF